MFHTGHSPASPDPAAGRFEAAAAAEQGWMAHAASQVRAEAQRRASGGNEGSLAARGAARYPRGVTDVGRDAPHRVTAAETGGGGRIVCIRYVTVGEDLNLVRFQDTFQDRKD